MADGPFCGPFGPVARATRAARISSAVCSVANAILDGHPLGLAPIARHAKDSLHQANLRPANATSSVVEIDERWLKTGATMNQSKTLLRGRLLILGTLRVLLGSHHCRCLSKFRIALGFGASITPMFKGMPSIFIWP